MSAIGKIFAHVAVVFTMLVLLFPAGASAFLPGETMYEPEQIELGSRRSGSFLGEGTDPNEPLTTGSGTSCPENDWTFDFTRWYYFWGTGEPVVVRADGGFDVGLALYEQDPTIEKMLVCRGWVPRRYQFDTKLGTLYRVQVGNWYDHESTGLGSSDYVVSLFPVAPNGTRLEARSLDLNGTAHLSSWGAPENFGGCSSSEGLGYEGERSAFGFVEVPTTGELKVDVEPERREWQNWMALLYPLGSDYAIACAVGDEPSMSTHLTPGPYLLRLTRAVQPRVDEQGSVEENWTVKTSFDPDDDGDGYLKSDDCNDANSAVHPDAEDVPDDGIDQNCDGVDAHRDRDGDGVPDYRDLCPDHPTQGIDANGDGCPDPHQLALVARVLLAVRGDGLHVASMEVRATNGAKVTLKCHGHACKTTVTKATKKQLQFRTRFDSEIPGGTVVTVSAQKNQSIGIEKSYRLSMHGVRLLHERCTMPSPSAAIVDCE